MLIIIASEREATNFHRGLLCELSGTSQNREP